MKTCPLKKLEIDVADKCYLQLYKLNKQLGMNFVSVDVKETNWEYIPDYRVCVGEDKCPIMKK